MGEMSPETPPSPAPVETYHGMYQGWTITYLTGGIWIARLLALEMRAPMKIDLLQRIDRKYSR